MNSLCFLRSEFDGRPIAAILVSLIATQFDGARKRECSKDRTRKVPETLDGFLTGWLNVPCDEDTETPSCSPRRRRSRGDIARSYEERKHRTIWEIDPNRRSQNSCQWPLDRSTAITYNSDDRDTRWSRKKSKKKSFSRDLINDNRLHNGDSLFTGTLHLAGEDNKFYYKKMSFVICLRNIKD